MDYLKISKYHSLSLDFDNWSVKRVTAAVEKKVKQRVFFIRAN